MKGLLLPENKRRTRQVVVVLGMHRSGTSVVTKSLELLGVSLGTRLFGARSDNPKGFWEDRDVVEIDDSLLACVGASWNTLIADPLRYLSEDTRSGVMATAVDLLCSRVSEFGLWGFKDPRCCRLIPFWRKAFDSAECGPLFVLVVRNPLSVAASLLVRDQMTRSDSLALWVQHVLPLLRDTNGHPRVVIDYDLFLQEPFTHLNRIAKALDLPTPKQGDPAVREYLDRFMSRNLRHAAHTIEELRSTPECSEAVGSLYELALSVVRGDATMDSDRFATRLHDISRALETSRS